MPESADTQTNYDPEVIARTEQLFFLLEHNITQDAKNTIWKFLTLAKDSYPNSPHKQEWHTLLDNLQTIIMDFDKDLSYKSELRLTGVHRNAQELKLDENEELNPEK